ncbi:hypothetical protein HX891_10990 [Pseudomonas reactans]|uniref:hypothetical protein n=1 Tax=Pseudomonas reactans TaxID=117680 RepID=UPI0015BC99C7|nr:hypothetical protein [Pseudomonas reactans]NWD80904.1 hypothetical protein [Pseudomonas reactans]
MDVFLDRSDELHVEILGLLDGVPAYPGVRHEVALVACGMALEHALSLRLFEWQLLADCFEKVGVGFRVRKERV